MAKFSSSSDVLAKVRAIVAEQFVIENIQDLSNGANFISDLGADSLDVVELVMALEEQFELQISDENTTKIKTVQDAADVLSEILGVK
jgi:acyl carrier protein